MTRTVADMAWQDDAACRGADPEIFFPDNSDHRKIVKALLWCNGCPVREACLQFALDTEGSLGHSSRSGIYGGHTAEQRYAKYRHSRGKPVNR